MDKANDHESHLLEAEMRPFQGRVQTVEDEPERLLQQTYPQTSEPLSHGYQPHDKLAAALRDAKRQIVALKEEIDKLCAPPHRYGTFRKAHADGTIDVSVDGRTLRVNVHPTIPLQELKAGQLLTLNEAYHVIGIAGDEGTGEVVHLQDVLDEHRAIVIGRADAARVVPLAEPLTRGGTKIGDPVRLDQRSGYALERLPTSDVAEVVLEDVPHVTHGDIGGLGPQIEALRDAIELPHLFPRPSGNTNSPRPRGFCCMGPQAAVRP
jgi:proteasome-associated ATPase